MRASAIALGIALALAAIFAPRSLPAQQASASALNEQQATGKRLFQQNCALCHLGEPENSKNPKDEGTSIGPRLEGVFRAPRSRPEAVVKSFIQQGVDGKMPGFRYGLEPTEIDAIIAYLKTL
jgi:mono/diheme cytochrome c family protein